MALPSGQCHILHPDETHDGGAGTDAGFCYRIVYVDPGLVQEALHGNPLPFVGHPVLDAARLPASGAAEVWDFDEDMDDVARTELVVAVANLLVGAASGTPRTSGPLALGRLSRVRDVIAATPAERRSMDELERLAVSTVGRSPGNFARHSAPAPAASASCGNWIMFGDC